MNAVEDEQGVTIDYRIFEMGRTDVLLSKIVMILMMPFNEMRYSQMKSHWFF